MSNFSSLDCPETDSEMEEIMFLLGFWIEGVCVATVASLGILFNVFSSIILSFKEMRNSFNLLLIALATFDTLYLVGSILESLRKSFGLYTRIQILLFPRLLYPGQMIVMTASIFMTVAIAMERYVAVHYPLDYNQAMNDERASLQRLLKYVIPVIIFSTIFNIPKFLEAEVTYPDNSTFPELGVTPLRLEANYAIYYNNWIRLLILGIIPFGALVFFNSKIYNDVQVRKRHRCPRFIKRNDVKKLPFNRNVNRRKYEDNLATVFLGIVLVFLFCHIPRIILSLHETVVIRNVMACVQASRGSFPVWSHILTYISHFLLVVNSSVNSIIYCGLSSRFRRQVWKILILIGNKIGIYHSDSSDAGALIMTSSITQNGIRASKGMTTFGGNEGLMENFNVTKATPV